MWRGWSEWIQKFEFGKMIIRLLYSIQLFYHWAGWLCRQSWTFLDCAFVSETTSDRRHNYSLHAHMTTRTTASHIWVPASALAGLVQVVTTANSTSAWVYMFQYSGVMCDSWFGCFQWWWMGCFIICARRSRNLCWKTGLVRTANRMQSAHWNGNGKLS